MSAADKADKKQDEIEIEIEALKARIRQLEQGVAETKGFREAAQEKHFELTERVKRMEEEYPTAEVEAPDEIRLGGSFWVNYAYQDFNRASRAKEGDFAFDLFRISAEGARGNVLFSGQYRFYGFMDAVHHAWVGYNFSERWQARLGITKVPFGTLPFASHSYWFGVPYYLGLEDDYDAGVKAVYDAAPWNLQLAFFKNAEWGNPGRLERYSFDVVTVDQANEETNQANVRLARTFTPTDAISTEVGGSFQWGQLYNSVTDDTGTHRATAVHISQFLGPWNMQLQGIRYEFDPRNPPGVADDLIEMGAFGTSRRVASEGDVLVFNVARKFSVDWGPVKSLTCYNDYSRLFKDEERFKDSQLNTLGCRIPTKGAYTFVDLIFARNATFLNDSPAASGFGPGSTDEWEVRFNINFEYYF